MFEPNHHIIAPGPRIPIGLERLTETITNHGIDRLMLNHIKRHPRHMLSLCRYGEYEHVITHCGSSIPDKSIP